MDKKAEKIFANKLQSPNKQEVIDTIKELRNVGNANLLYELISLLNKTTDKEISNVIIKLLYDIKDNSSKQVIIDSIKNPEYKRIKKTLVSACWQGLPDYSEYLDVFVDLFINDDFEIAFEAFTVIDNMEKPFDNEVVKQTTNLLKQNLKQIDEMKQTLTLDLIKIIEKNSAKS